ncbi:hypothetical protein FACS1894196_4860 [Clostridia bacterium]|nr:hypothetical protein FACS1894196_4860 [Clostridia bacterium]
MVFTVYMNENGRAVEAGNVSAPDYETAKAFVISEADIHNASAMCPLMKYLGDVAEWTDCAVVFIV